MITPFYDILIIKKTIYKYYNKCYNNNDYNQGE